MLVQFLFSHSVNQRDIAKSERQIKQMAFLKSTTKILAHNLNHVSNPHPSLQAEKRDKWKQICKAKATSLIQRGFIFTCAVNEDPSSEYDYS